MPHCPAGPVDGGLDSLDVVGQGPYKSRDRRVRGNRPEDLLLAPQQRKVRQAPTWQGHAHRQIQDDLARIVHRPLDCWAFFGQCLFVFQAAFFRSRNSRSTSFGVRYPRAE